MKKAFDLESVYDNEISPLMVQIIEICKKNNLPMFFSACYKNDPSDPNGEMFCTTTILPEDRKPKVLREFHNRIYGNGSQATHITVDHGDGTKTLTAII